MSKKFDVPYAWAWKWGGTDFRKNKPLSGGPWEPLYTKNQMEKAIFDEREACAKVCDDIDVEYEGEDVLATWCAAAIRSRKTT